MQHADGESARTPPPHWYADTGFYVAVFATLALKLLLILLLITSWRQLAWVEHLKYDLSTWGYFFYRTGHGAVPYVDFPREYPVGAGLFYWLIAPLFQSGREQPALLAHTSVMAGCDVLNTALFYPLARSISARRALWGTLLMSWSPTSLVLSPLRFESVLVTTLLIGYALHKRGHNVSAAAVWSFGATIKWFPGFLLAAQELKTYCGDRSQHRWWRSLAVFVAVQMLVNAPFLIGGWVKHHSIAAWTQTYLYHLLRPLSADTLAGMAQLWLGPLPWERLLAPAALLMALTALLVRPSLPLTQKAVLITVAMVICNRIYSPQFNLWFYPFFILHLLAAPRARMLQLVALFVLLDLSNVMVYPFAFTRVLEELGSFQPFAAANSGGPWTLFWSACIVLRCLLLVLLARAMLTRAAEAPLASSAKDPQPAPAVSPAL